MSDKPNFAELTDPNDVADSLCECDGYQGSLSTLAELKPAVGSPKPNRPSSVAWVFATAGRWGETALIVSGLGFCEVP